MKKDVWSEQIVKAPLIEQMGKMSKYLLVQTGKNIVIKGPAAAEYDLLT